MSHATSRVASPPPQVAMGSGRRSPVLFQSLVLTQPERRAGRQGTTLFVSSLLHGTLVVAVAIGPLLFYDGVPTPGALNAFFVAPLEMAPPPPPPPPPPPGARAAVKSAPKVEMQQRQGFVVPVAMPDQIKAEEDLGAAYGAVGGVEGGVPDGVVGAIVAGLPREPPPPAEKLVRVGGQINEPKKIRSVAPVYPDLALQSHLSALVVLEAEVDTRGQVRAVRLLRGHPVFDDAAIAAVSQWRYQPLLLNGEPTAFVLTVTVKFNLQPR
jgi:protein TonB